MTMFGLEMKEYRVLFVCHGNICRSPMGEAILKKMVNDTDPGMRFHIESAAVSREEIGNPIYPPAKRCLSGHNIPFDNGKTARQVEAADYCRFDLIVCMDEWNVRLLKRIIPSDPMRKIRLMMSFAGQSRDVADPWYTGDFEKTYQDLALGCKALLNQIMQDGSPALQNG